MCCGECCDLVMLSVTIGLVTPLEIESASVWDLR